MSDPKSNPEQLTLPLGQQSIPGAFDDPPQSKRRCSFCAERAVSTVSYAGRAKWRLCKRHFEAFVSKGLVAVKKPEVCGQLVTINGQPMQCLRPADHTGLCSGWPE